MNRVISKLQVHEHQGFTVSTSHFIGRDTHNRKPPGHRCAPVTPVPGLRAGVWHSHPHLELKQLARRGSFEMAPCSDAMNDVTSGPCDWRV
ncbi:hypothetical protein JZ751_020161 [Albula glossodonta]|uniref:Uncharacterized protein n=1 Tax=Albula glossodonta TaxID=121402 RepID=A0A8T2NTX1_9TELE|nr:hypothetical protein JZ751_020161 [Albula glossodonta]